MAKAKTLIDLEAARGYVQTFLADPILKMAANAVLDNAPKVDAVEVVHGRWKNGTCTNCGQVDFSKPNYCPNCGADMRGEADV